MHGREAVELLAEQDIGAFGLSLMLGLVPIVLSIVLHPGLVDALVVVVVPGRGRGTGD